jgi:sugar lactone lactonase YvrE
MVMRNVIVCAASAVLSALLTASCGGGSIAVLACSGSPCVVTVAGSGQVGNADGASASATFTMPHAVVLDASGGLHVADYGTDGLTRLVAQGTVSTLPEDPIDFPHPADVAVDANGTSYVADTYANRILKVTAAGETSVLAGTGESGSADGDASIATFSMPAGLAFDARGDLYVADMGNRRIRKITLS